MRGFYETGADWPEGLPYAPMRGPGVGYAPGEPRRYVVGGRWGLQDPRAVDNPAGDGLPAAFLAPALGRVNVAGLTFLAEPGTLRQPIRTFPVAWSPSTPTRPGLQANYFTAAFSVYLNKLLHRPFAPGWHKAPVPAVNPRLEAPPRGQRGMQMRAPGVFGKRVTAWPRTILAWPTFGRR